MKKTLLILSGIMLMLTSLFADEVGSGDEFDCISINVRTEEYGNYCESMCAQSADGVMEMCEYLMDKGRSVRYAYLSDLDGRLKSYYSIIDFRKNKGEAIDSRPHVFAQKKKDLEMFFEVLVSSRANLNSEVRESFRHLVFCLTYPACGSKEFTAVSKLFDDVLERMNVTKEEVLGIFRHPIMETDEGDL